jgi:hypothetical protein
MMMRAMGGSFPYDLAIQGITTKPPAQKEDTEKSRNALVCLCDCLGVLLGALGVLVVDFFLFK